MAPSRAYVPPDGPVPCEFAIVGEAPASEEVKEGKGFVGPSGALLWQLLWEYARLERRNCYVTNLCKTPLDNNESGDAKMSPTEFSLCASLLLDELARVKPAYVLAVGALAAKALLGDMYTTMEACNELGFPVQLPLPGGGWWKTVVVPTFHPAAALRGGGGEKDTLAFTAAAMKRFKSPTPFAVDMTPPEPFEWSPGFVVPYGTGPIGIDSEGIPSDPICMTVAYNGNRYIVAPHHVPEFFAQLQDDVTLVFFNAPWDWRVLWAMGAPEDIAERWRWTDISEINYLAQTEPTNLKDTAYRELGIRMPSFLKTVWPHYDALVKAAAEQRIAQGSYTVTKRKRVGYREEAVSPKTGKPYKKPKRIAIYEEREVPVVPPELRPLQRALANPKLLAERMDGVLPWVRPSKKSGLSSVLRVVPDDALIEYATLDAWVTYRIAVRWGLHVRATV